MLGDPETSANAPAPFEVLYREKWQSSTIRVSTANSILAVGRSPGTVEFFHLDVPGEKSAITLPPLPHSAMRVSIHLGRLQIVSHHPTRIPSFLPSSCSVTAAYFLCEGKMGILSGHLCMPLNHMLSHRGARQSSCLLRCNATTYRAMKLTTIFRRCI